MTKNIIVTPKVLTATFSNYEKFVFNGTCQGPTINLHGLISGDKTPSISGRQFTAVDAGTYLLEVKEVVNTPNYILEDVFSIEYKIEPKVITATLGDEIEFDYDGEEHMAPVVLNDLVEGYNAYPKGDDVYAENAGFYHAIIDETSSKNYVLDQVYTIDWKINKATYDMSMVEYVDKIVPYNGSYQYLEITGELPDGVSVQYSKDDCEDVGEYEIIASFIGDSINYEEIPSMSATLTIRKALITKFSIIKEDYDGNRVSSLIYKGDYYNIYGYAIDENGKNHYDIDYIEGNYYKDAGTYTLTPKLDSDYEYNGPELSIIIAPREITLEFSDYENLIYNKEEHKININLNGVLVGDVVNANATNITGTNAGEYQTTVNSLDNNNYVLDKEYLLTWYIQKQQLEKPLSDNNVYIYNGDNQTYIIEENDNYTVSGNIQKNVGEYKVNVELNDSKNYEWSDGTVDILEYQFNILKSTFNNNDINWNISNEPMIYTGNNNEIVLDLEALPDGSEVEYVITDSNGNTVDQIVDAGDYIISATIKNPNFDDLTITTEASILKIKIEKPITNDKIYTYNGKEQTYIIEENHNYIVLGNVQKDAGKHIVTVELKDSKNYEWSDGTIDILEYQFNILKSTFNNNDINWNISNEPIIYTGNNNEIVLDLEALPDGSEVEYLITDSNGNTVDQIVDAGDYIISATIKNPNFDDLIITTEASILKIKIEKPITNDKIYTYNGKEQTYIIEENDNYIILGNVQKDVGKHTVTVELKDSNNYEWSDGTIDILEYQFEILKDETSYLWLIITLSIVAFVEIISLFIQRNKKKKATYANSTIIPTFLILSSIPKTQLIIIIILGILVVGLLVANILYARKKPKTNEEKSDTIINNNTLIIINNDYTNQNNEEPVLITSEEQLEEEIIEEPIVEEVLEEVIEEPIVEEEIIEEVLEEEVFVIDEEELQDGNNTIIIDYVIDESNDNEPLEQIWDEDTNQYILVSYYRSFESRIIQAKDIVKDYYSILKNEILSYQKVKNRLSFKHESFKQGKNSLVKMTIRGKTLCLYFALDPNDYIDTKYKIEDVSNKSVNSKYPCLYRITSNLKCKYAKDLIKNVMDKNNIANAETDIIDYKALYPYLDDQELINRDLIKVVKA